MRLRLVEVAPDDPRLKTDVHPVMAELRPGLGPAEFAGMHAEGYAQGLRYTAGYDDGGRCVAVAGWRRLTTSRGRLLYVDDLVTVANRRSTGLGEALLAEMERRGVAAGYERLELGSGVGNAAAHRFYFRRGMGITAFHFAKRLLPDAAYPRSSPASR